MTDDTVAACRAALLKACRHPREVAAILEAVDLERAALAATAEWETP